MTFSPLTKLISALLVISTGQALAVTTFTNAVNQDYNNAGNWSSGIPTGTENVVIGASQIAAVTTAVASTYSGGVVLQSGSRLDLSFNDASTLFAWAQAPSP